MHLRLNINSIEFDHEIVRRLVEIEEFKGSWLTYRNLPRERLNALQQQAYVDNIGLSSKAQQPSKLLHSHSVQEVAGYTVLMQWIYSAWERIPLTEENIKKMHSILMQYSPADSLSQATGKNREAQEETTNTTSVQMEEIIRWTNQELKDKNLPAIIVIGIFIVYFLTIRPLKKGNKQLSHALTILLLMRAGYAYLPYRSLERIFELTKLDYDFALQATQKTLTNRDPQWHFWLSYFVKSLAQQTQNLKAKLAIEDLFRTMPETSVEIIDLIRLHGSMSMKEIESYLKVNPYTLRNRVKRLTKDGYLIRNGKGRASKYQLK